MGNKNRLNLNRKSSESIKSMKKRDIKGLIVIALPLMLQNMVRGLLGSVDKVFVGQIGEEAIAGLGGANQIFSLFLTVFMAIAAGLTVLLSQYAGGFEWKKFKEALSTMVGLGILAGLFLTLSFRLGDELFLRSLNIRGEALIYGKAYFGVLSFSTPFLLLSSIFSGVFLALKKNVYPMIATFISMGSNALLNGVFLFVMNLGIVGIAYATLISRILELLILMFLLKKYLKELAIPRKIRIYRGQLASLLTISVPMALDGAAWQLAMTLYTRMVFTIGVQEVAVYEILKIFQTVTLTALAALATANVGIIGQELGKGDFARAKEKAKAGIGTAFMIATLLNLVVFLLAGPLFRLFQLDESTVAMGMSALPLVLFIIYAQVNNVVFPYILRSGGDTWANLRITVIGFWGIQIPGAYLFGIHLEGGIMGILFSMLLAEGIKGLLFYRRYKKGTWMRNLS